jgi:hypothetical protein
MCSAEAAMAPMNAQAQYAQGKQNKAYYDYLAEQTRKQSEEVDKATGEQVSVISQDAGRQTSQVIQDSNQTIAAQKAAMAANGVYSDSATSNDIISDTIDKRAIDEAMVRYNADRAIWQTRRSAINQKIGLSSQESDYRIKGANAKAAGKIGAFGTLVGGAYSGAEGAARAGAGKA